MILAGGSTIALALAAAQALGLDRLDARWLLGHVLGQTSAWLLAHDDQPLAAGTALAYATLCQRRAAGEPLAYLTGHAGFHGLQLQVTPDVLVPRPDTETLVDWALDLLPAPPLVPGQTPQVLDLGTGSGAIALAVAHHRPGVQVTATDLSPAALAVAQSNAGALGLGSRLRWAQGAWWQALPASASFDLVLSNPPYIAGDDPHLPALRHEPRLALTPGGDGLDALRAIVAGAPAHLRPGGWLLLEHGWDQAADVAALLAAAGFQDIAHRADLAGRPRCTGGRREAPIKG